MIDVVMLHSVGNNQSNWSRFYISVSMVHFEQFCIFLKQKQYKSIFLNDWYTAQNDNSLKKGNQIVLTFDDGYLDNWLLVYPLLKKYDLKASVFINPEFVDSSKGLRKISDIGDLKNENTLGFLNWDEIIEMDKSGVFDVQSHSMSHNFYFKSNKIIDIYSGQPKYDWLMWFLIPELKSQYMNGISKESDFYGYPIFEFGRALSLRMYFPDQKLIDYSISTFQKKTLEKHQLIELIENKMKEFPGQCETNNQMEERYRYELFESKRILEEKLNKKIDFLCWPGGGYNELSINLSIEAGYKASTIASMDRRKSNKNIEYKRIKRLGLGSFMTIYGKRKYVTSKRYLIDSFKAKKGEKWNLFKTRIIKLMLIAKNMI